MTVMFLHMWSVVNRTPNSLEHEPYLPHTYHPEQFEGSGYVQPYSDTPLDGEVLGENVYLNIINRAKKYVYICTPYLIIDNEMMTALCLAAKSGVDVRIMTPGVPDKKMVFLLTQSYTSSFLRRECVSMSISPVSFTQNLLCAMTRLPWLVRSIWITAACICILKTVSGCIKTK